MYLKQTYHTAAAIAAAVMALSACTLEKEVDEAPKAFSSFEMPPHFPPPVHGWEDNPITKAGFELGRKLFYDPGLSSTGDISCGTCHAQAHAFADHNTPFSAGVHGLIGNRNAPPTVNLMWMPELMWDGRFPELLHMPTGPITDPIEMDMDMDALVAYLNQHEDYPALFEAAFGESLATEEHMLKAMAQFQGSIVSARSKYDDYDLGRDVLDAKEMRGLEIFEAKCSTCHPAPLFTDHSFRSNGLSDRTNDTGRMAHTGIQEDNGKFKVPSLRNVRLTHPYMHDGQFFTLRQVLDHYSEGIEATPNLDPLLEGGIPLSEDEKEDLIAFLITLSDFELMRDLRYSEP